MKKVIMLVGLIVSFIFGGFSQDYTMLNRYMEDLNKLGETFSQVKSYSEIKGTPYFNVDFLDGKIVTLEDKIVNVKLRYNIYADEIEFLYSEKIYSIAKPISIKEFYIGDQKIMYSSYSDGNSIKRGFLFVINQGNYTLFAKKRVEFLLKDKEKPYSTPMPDRFEPRDDMFLLSAYNKPIYRLLTKKKLLKEFPELETFLVKYNEKINFRKKEDLNKLFTYINSETTKQ